MSVILLVLGILITGVGVAAVGFGIPINESALGQTLIMAGATTFVGGLLLIGLAAAVTQLSAIAQALKTKPARPAEIKQPDVKRKAEIPAGEPRAPEPRPSEPAPAAVDVSSSAIERLRSTMPRPDRVVTHEEVPLSPNGGGQQPTAPELKPEPPQRSAEAVEAKEPRLDFLFRSKNPRSAPPESFDAMWPKRGGRGASDQPKADEVARQPAPPPAVEERRVPPPPPPISGEEPRSVAILKSGVVDGMAYTLYADGSIEAQLPHGTVRFGSIAELRAHIENNS